MTDDLLDQLAAYRHSLEDAIRQSEETANEERWDAVDSPDRQTSSNTIQLHETSTPPALDLVRLTAQGTRQGSRKRTVGRLLAAAAAVALVGVILATEGDNVVETEPAATTTPSTVAPTTAVGAPTTADALAVVEEFFAANEAADFDAMQALFTPDATFPGVFTIAGDEQLFAWNAAQGTTISERECSPNDPAEGSVLVRCTFLNHDALVQAVDGPPVPISLNLRVGLDGITTEFGDFGSPNFNTVGVPFDAWMFNNYPDDQDRIGFGDWTSIEEAEENGLLVVEYAAEWADYLTANGCTYLDGC